MEEFLKIFESISGFDLIYIFFTLLSLMKCYRKGFVLSILAASKWLFAYVLTLFLFPKVKPYVKDIIDNDYVLDISLGITLFVIIIFVILLINKGIKKAVTFTATKQISKRTTLPQVLDKFTSFIIYYKPRIFKIFFIIEKNQGCSFQEALWDSRTTTFNIRTITIIEKK